MERIQSAMSDYDSSNASESSGDEADAVSFPDPPASFQGPRVTPPPMHYAPTDVPNGGAAAAVFAAAAPREQGVKPAVRQGVAPRALSATAMDSASSSTAPASHVGKSRSLEAQRAGETARLFFDTNVSEPYLTRRRMHRSENQTHRESASRTHSLRPSRLSVLTAELARQQAVADGLREELQKALQRRDGPAS